ncbi:hypothetical protein BV22DRAFT_1047268 [Leucogyrophana mollusca]|uniref:Uncharacterized protein n=1 Tax=Leucogyrophana mollusca TaxID=85980 RepID=A0ACB8BGR4_9AGAM|nr:hypothetical protein BV22DRAFT_1047268 [Leucogyrophana mollusca]
MTGSVGRGLRVTGYGSRGLAVARGGGGGESYHRTPHRGKARQGEARRSSVYAPFWVLWDTYVRTYGARSWAGWIVYVVVGIRGALVGSGGAGRRWGSVTVGFCVAPWYGACPFGIRYSLRVNLDSMGMSTSAGYDSGARVGPGQVVVDAVRALPWSLRGSESLMMRC